MNMVFLEEIGMFTRFLEENVCKLTCFLNFCFYFVGIVSVYYYCERQDPQREKISDHLTMVYRLRFDVCNNGYKHM